MSRRAFFALIGGLALIVVSVALLMAYRDYKDTNIPASNAVLEGTVYYIGIDYTGVLVEQHAEKGQFVREGDLLGRLKSGSLIERMREAELTTDDLPYQLDKDDNIELRATNDGVITEINYTGGSFVPANQQIYEIVTADQYFVKATYEGLSKNQIEKLDTFRTAEITYRDDTAVPGSIRDLTIEQEGSLYNAELELVPGSQPNAQTVTVGEPVQAVLILKEENAFSRLKDVINGIRDVVWSNEPS
jgi:multidrug resistance efflux pump